MSSGVCLAEPVPAVAVDEGDPQGQLPRSHLPEDADDGERAAGTTADDRDDGTAASEVIIRGVHKRRIIYYFDMINRVLPAGRMTEIVTIDTPPLGDRSYLRSEERRVGK